MAYIKVQVSKVIEAIDKKLLLYREESEEAKQAIKELNMLNTEGLKDLSIFESDRYIQLCARGLFFRDTIRPLEHLKSLARLSLDGVIILNYNELLKIGLL